MLTLKILIFKKMDLRKKRGDPDFLTGLLRGGNDI
jgi:hypothetical protein